MVPETLSFYEFYKTRRQDNLPDLIELRSQLLPHHDLYNDFKANSNKILKCFDSFGWKLIKAVFCENLNFFYFILTNMMSFILTNELAAKFLHVVTKYIWALVYYFAKFLQMIVWNLFRHVPNHAA